MLGAPPAFNKLFDPLFLYARAIVVPGSGGAPNVAALMNPHGMSMELLAVQWQVYPQNTTTENFGRMTGMGVGVKMDLGDIPIVDANVPVSAFGTARDDGDPLVNNITIYPDPDVTTIIATPQTYKWRLKHPLLIPAGCVLTEVFSHLGQNHFPVVVDTLYICRTLPTSYVVPATFKVPWAGSYNSIGFDNLAEQPARRDFSSELDIVNPFRQPLELARMTGRVSATFNGSGGVNTNIEDRTDHRFHLGKIRMRSRSGDEIARNKTPFNGMFPYGWRAWDIPGGWTMRPHEFYKVQLTVDATDATAPDDSELGSVQFSITSVGYRTLPRDVFVVAATSGDRS